MTFKKSLFSLIVLGSVSATSFAAQPMAAQGGDWRDRAQGIFQPAMSGAESSAMADQTRTMGASRSDRSAQADGMMDRQTDAFGQRGFKHGN